VVATSYLLGVNTRRVEKLAESLDARNLATKVPKAAQPRVSTLVRTIFEQPDAACWGGLESRSAPGTSTYERQSGL
jgi:transposase-like protein